MTASPASGMPSAEAIEAEIRPMAYDGADLTECVERILALIRPAFEAKEREIHKLTSEVVKWSTAAGEAEGRLRMSEAAGIVEGWRDRALAAEATLAKKEREIERLQEAAEYWPETSASWQARALSAEAKLAQAVEARKKLDRRIHNQRVALRENWMIVERRAKSLRSSALHVYKRGRALMDSARAASNIGQKIGQNEGEKM